MLSHLNPRWFGTQALVLCPTRELADQVAQELRRLARCADNIKVLTLCGGVPIGYPADRLARPCAHIIVGTPGRIRDHLGRQSIDLSGVQTLVLDEADRMVDMGFYDEIAGIVSACPSGRRCCFPPPIRTTSAAPATRVSSTTSRGQGRGIARRQPDRAKSVSARSVTSSATPQWRNC